MIIFNSIGILYLLSGMWCVFQADKSMSFLGLGSVNSYGVGEFVTVYGGLQLGIGLGMILVNWLPQYYSGTLFFATILSFALIAVRVFTLVSHGFFLEGNLMAGLELIIAASLLTLFWQQRSLG